MSTSSKSSADRERCRETVNRIRRDLDAGFLAYTGNMAFIDYIAETFHHDDPVKVLNFIAADMEGELIVSKSSDMSTDDYLNNVVRSVL